MNATESTRSSAPSAKAPIPDLKERGSISFYNTPDLVEIVDRKTRIVGLGHRIEPKGFFRRVESQRAHDLSMGGRTHHTARSGSDRAL